MIRIDGSFRDPDGFMFESKGKMYRAVNHSYQPAYDHLLTSGLYQKLADRGMIIPFEEVNQVDLGLSGFYKILKPERIRFISYPYEWAFNMLKDAALLTLEIQLLALEHGMSLKDASAFNVQFQNGKPVFIDTLSFELYPVDRPWVAYRQFCQHFLAPLALMTYVDPGLNRMFIIHIDGIPLDLATKMLPFRSRFRLGLYLHLFLHSKSQQKHKDSTIRFESVKKRFPKGSMIALLEGLKTTVENLHWNPRGTEWADYIDEGVHAQEYTEFKTKIVAQLLEEVKPLTVWDLGANTGIYSRLAAQKGSHVISFDVDPACVTKNYKLVRKNRETNILPLLQDLLNTSPSFGWGGTERLSVFKRNKPDLIMALAIIHHLAISANTPLASIAAQFAELAEHLIIEFVPKEDEKVQILLLNRKDIFSEYSQSGFESAFTKFYTIKQIIPSDCNFRIFYLMTKK
jgi:hypothetical protein